MKSVKSLTLCIVLFSLSSFAQTFVGTVVAVQGDVKVLHVPTPQDHRPFAKMNGQEYAYVKAKIGMKLNPGEIILSGPNGKIKIVYPNGDSFLVGSGSSFVLPALIDAQADPSQVKDGATSSVSMFYGRFRALISKEGPRNNMRVVTPDAVAGVRGTDFFVRRNASVGTQLTVLRGTVTMRSKHDLSHAVDIQAGYSAATNMKSNTQPRPEEATREDILSAQKETAVKANPHAIAKLPPAEQEDIHSLQTKAFESVMNDIKDHNPNLYQELQKKGVKDTDQIDNTVVTRLAQNAPSTRKRKPTREDLEHAGQNTYKQYYKHHQHQ